MYAGFGIHIIFDHKDLYLESKELKCLNFHKLCQCIKLKAFTRLYFENRQYEASFYCVRLASYVFGAGTNEVSGDNDFQKNYRDLIRKKQIKDGQSTIKLGPKKKQYLEIMNQQNFTAFAETAEYIKQHIETDKNHLMTLLKDG